MKVLHDALYFLVKKDPEVLMWVNDNLIECMEWQNDPLIQHPDIKLGGGLDIFYPTWNDSTGIPNKANLTTITDIMEKL